MLESVSFILLYPEIFYGMSLSLVLFYGILTVFLYQVGIKSLYFLYNIQSNNLYIHNAFVCQNVKILSLILLFFYFLLTLPTININLYV